MRENKEMQHQKAGSWDISAVQPQIAISIDKDKGSREALKWTLENLVNRGQTLLLIHVKPKNQVLNQPSSDESYAKEIFVPFRCFCSRKDVVCKDVILEDDDIARGVIEYATQNGVEKLVLGSNSRNGFSSRLKPYDVPATVFKEAPDFCTVYIILNGKVSSCKNATRPAPTIGYFRQDLMEDGIIDDSIPESNSPIILQHPQFMLPPDSYLPNINFNSENKEILIMLEEKDFSKKIDGFPTISFTESEYHASLISTKSLALVRCSHGTPDLATTRKFFIQKLSPMLGRFSILQWKKYSFLVNFKCYDDYLKALMLESFSQGKFTFRFSKWFPGYLNGGESPLLPTWIEFPDLDINWYSEEFVTALASCFGKVLKVAETTKRLEEGAEAKVCVERDISCPLPEKMWIDICGQGYWQKVRAVTKQKYCSCCYKRGHDTKECRKNNKDQLPTSFTPKKKKTIDQETTSSPHAEQETQITKFITSIEKDLSNFLQDQAKLHFPMESQNQLDNQDDKLDDTGDVKTTNQEEKESSEMSNQADSSSSSSPSDQPNERPT